MLLNYIFWKYTGATDLQNHKKISLILYTRKKWKKKKMIFGYKNKKIQPGYKNRIWYWKMCHAQGEKWKKTNNGRNKTGKWGKIRNTWRKGKLQIFWNTWNGQHKTSGYEGKIRKENFRRTKKLLEVISSAAGIPLKGIGDYIKKSKERLLITMVTNGTDNKSTNRAATKISEREWEEEQMWGYFKR